MSDHIENGSEQFRKNDNAIKTFVKTESLDVLLQDINVSTMRQASTLEEMFVDMKFVKTHLNAIERKIDNFLQCHQPSTNQLIDNRFVFPIATVENCDEFLAELGVQSSYETELRIRLKNLGGKSVDALVRKIWSFLFNLHIQKQFNWSGLNNKRNLCDSPLYNLARSAVYLAFPEACEKIISDTTKRYFQNSSCRIKQQFKK